jgi:hypothetical protein
MVKLLLIKLKVSSLNVDEYNALKLRKTENENSIERRSCSSYF